MHPLDSLIGVQGASLFYFFIWSDMKKKVVELIRTRLDEEIAPQSPLRYLKDIPPEEYIDELISTIYLYTRTKRGTSSAIYLTEVISAIGHKIRNILKLKKDSAVAAKTGAFMLYTFELIGLIEVMLGQGKKGHAAYIVTILDDRGICELWSDVTAEKIQKLPSENPYAPWESTTHETGTKMVKTGNRGVLAKIKPETHPMLFECLNRAQKIGWRINKEVYDVQTWALRNKATAFNDIWDQQNPQAKTTKLREAQAIGEMASRFLEKTFYHLYYYDFRGRKYSATAYLHEQGSDAAKGLLLRDDKKKIGKDGFFWLMVSAASNWGGESGREDGLKTDKIPLEDRYNWSLDNAEILLSYAENPKVNQGWMSADKPWQFFATCVEFKKIIDWVNWKNSTKMGNEPQVESYDYESHLECYIDGTNNGSQHLSALTLDEITAPHVNLVPLELPGDLYKYVADHVWKKLEEKVNKLSPERRNRCDALIDDIIELKKEITAAEPKSQKRADLIEVIWALKEEEKDLMEDAGAVFWNRITDSKERRKIVKRNVMTLPYGGTAYGLGQQVIDDSKRHGIEQLLYMEHKWGAFLGRETFEDCQQSLQRPMRLLKVFEMAGKKAEQEGRFLSWIVPITNFPVVQNYTQGKVKKIYVQYGPRKGLRNSTGYYPNTLQLSICFLEDMEPSKRKQSQGASPNAIHSLDAAHLTMTVCACDFGVTTVHDSFGCLLADMPILYSTIRKTFVELYKTDPLTSIMKDIDGDMSSIEYGTLNINDILDSEYCFA